MQRLARSVPVLLLCGTLAVSGCSSEQEPRDPSAAASAGASADAPSDAASDSDSESGGGASASGAGVEQVDVEDVLVEQTLVAVDDPDSSLKVGVLSLEVQDEVMRLELALTPDVASVPDDQRQSVFDLRFFYADPALIDRGNLKRYEVVRAAPGKRYESDPVTTDTVNGRPMRVFYYFAAPQDDIDSIDVVLSDRYPAFTDVPIT